MALKTIGVSEARRLLPHLVETLARDGGRVDITHHGQPRVSIVRTSDLDQPGVGDGAELPFEALRVELADPTEDLVERIRELRSRTGQPRPMPPSPKRRGSGRGKAKRR